jgi:hypothetical protein
MKKIDIDKLSPAKGCFYAGLFGVVTWIIIFIIVIVVQTLISKL